MMNSVIHKKRRWLIPLALLVILGVSFFAYVSIYYHADETARLAMNSDEAVSIKQTSYGWLFDGPNETDALIFYPGAKVEETAYAPLLHELAANGIDVCLVKMPFRLAILNSAAADKVMREHEYANWYIGGHSLGGAMAANYAASHGDKLSGIILLAAYATKRIPDPLKEIVLTGSEDRVLNWEKLERGKAFAPTNYVEYIIEGGNHAGFGSYGAQRGDGDAAIQPQEQVRETVRLIIQNIRNH